MNITIYKNFTKRRNSTKQPTGGTSITCTLKEGTSIEKPSFVLSSNDFTINYVSAFGHYYFVDDIISVRNGVLELKCTIDIGASFKSAIGSYSAFIERAATYHNDFLPDPDVAIINDENLYSTVSTTSSIFSSTGRFVISVLNNLGSGNGFTTYYVISASDLEGLAAYCNTDWGSSASDFLDWVQSTFLKTAESIIDCIWVPISSTALVGLPLSTETVKIGVDVVSGVQAARVTAPCIVSDSVTITIPHIYTDFRKGAPYTIGKLFIPGYGVVDFNPLDFKSDTMHLYFDIDITTGDTICYLKDTDGKLVATYTYNIAVSCPVGKVGANVTQTVGGLVSTAFSTVGAIVSHGGKALALGAEAASSGINTLASAIGPTASVHGAKGGRAIAANGLNCVVTLITKPTTDPDDLLYNHGRPLMATYTISSFSGYVKCSGAEVPITGTDTDKAAVNDMLNSGFYYE